MERSQRNNLILLVVSFFVFVVITVLAALLTGRQPTRDLEERASTFFTDPSGTRATFLVLQRLLPEVEVWRRPLLYLTPPDEGGPSTLVVSAPSRPLLADEREALLEWVEAGGQLLLALERDWPVERFEEEDEAAPPSTPSDVASSADGASWTPLPAPAVSPIPAVSPAPAVAPMPAAAPEAATDFEPASSPASVSAPASVAPEVPPIPVAPVPFLKSLGVVLEPALAEERKVRPWRSGLHAEPLTLYLRAPSTLTGLGEPLLTREQAVAGLALKRGKGRVVVLGDAAFFSNRSLRRGDNLVFLVHLLERQGGQRVAFDEFHHGFGEPRPLSSLVVSFMQTPYGWGVAQLVLALLLYVLGVKRRQGRVVPEPVPSWGSPLLLVRARAGLLQHARARGLAVELMVQHLSMLLGRALGRSLELEALRNHVLARRDGPTLEADLDALLALQRRARGASPSTKQEGSLSVRPLQDAELVRAGQLAGRILQEVNGERNV